VNAWSAVNHPLQFFVAAYVNRPGIEMIIKTMHKRVFFGGMERVVPWNELVGLIKLFAPGGAGPKGGCPCFAVKTMLRIHFMQQWFGLSDPAMEEALHEVPLWTPVSAKAMSLPSRKRTALPHKA
jgi:Transposase domain (DUF772)